MSRILAPSKFTGPVSLANPTAATAFKQGTSTLALTKAAFVYIPVDSGAVRGAFLIRAIGRATTGTTSNFLAKLQYTTDVTPSGQVTAATAGNNTDFYTLTNRSLASVTRSWKIECEIHWDSTSQRMVGRDAGSINGETIETSGAIITALTAVDLTTRKCGFVVAALFGSTNAGNIAYLDDLSLESL